GHPYDGNARRQLRRKPAIAAGFRRARQAMVSRQSAASGTASGARPALGLAPPSPDRNWILLDGTALVHFSGIRNPGIVASAVCQARVFSKRILAISDMASAGSNS